MIGLLFSPFQLSLAASIQKTQWFDRFFSPPKKIIIIDAGHGGTEPGSVKQGIQEKDINLQIALQLQKRLEAKGYKVVMTRDDDTAISLKNRAKLANQAKGDLLISIHQNSFRDASVHGIEVYYNSDKTTNDQQLAQMIQESLINETGAKNRGIHSDNGLVVTRETIMPAVLVETAFISNDDELDLIMSDDYQNKVVKGIVVGIEEFLNELDRNPE